MNTLVLYFILANLGLAAFYLFFRLLLQKDTFFAGKRIALLVGIALALTYPLLDLSSWIQRSDSLVAYADVLRERLPVIPATATVLANEVVSENGVEQTEAVTLENADESANAVVPVSELESASGMESANKTLSFTLFDYILLIYILTTVFLLFRIARQLIRIRNCRKHAERRCVHGQWVYVLKGCRSPFSFFKAVFIDPDAYSEKDQLDIIEHEKVHIRKGHSFDVLFSEGVCALFWINPFAWLLKRSLRENLEFLADNKVIKKGIDPKTYQYKLLQLSCHRSDANLANHFNVSQLKKRIVMMNKKRTSWKGLGKYTLYLPLFAALLLTAYAWGQQHETEAKVLVERATADSKVVEALTMDEKTLLAQNTPIKQEAEKSEKSTQTSSPDVWSYSSGYRSMQVYNNPDKAAQFPGGQETLYDYLKSNIKFPYEAKLEGEQGWLNVQFIVDERGFLTRDFKYLNSKQSYAFSREFQRVFDKLRQIRWKPAFHTGVAVASAFTIPFVFKYEGEHPVDESKLANSIIVVAKRDKEAENQYKNKDFVFKADIMPQFPGGQTALFNYLHTELRNPLPDIDEIILVDFTVEKDGSVNRVIVYSPELYDPIYVAEAIRVVKEMPTWIPGEDNGKKVAVSFSLPVIFNPHMSAPNKTTLVMDKNEPKLLIYNGRIINKGVQLNSDTMREEQWIDFLGLNNGTDKSDMPYWSSSIYSTSAPILVNSDQPYVYGMIVLSSIKR